MATQSGGIRMSKVKAVSAVAAPDWVTAIADGATDRRILRDVAGRYLALALAIHPWRLRAYVGRATADIPTLDGGVATGEDLVAERTILQAWGALTQRCIEDVLRCHGLRWTRCDLAVTILYDSALDAVIDWAVDWQHLDTPVSFISSNGPGGGTCYVGARGSEQFGRIYDKGVQLGSIPERMYWRWEVEFKRESGANVVAELMSRELPEDRARWVEDCVVEWFKSRNVPAPERGRLPIQYPVIRYSSRVTSDQTTIKWLSEQVKPALRRLQLNGRVKEALTALGVGASCLMPYLESFEDDPYKQLAMLDILQDSDYTGSTPS
jgi:hypothetical protein